MNRPVIFLNGFKHQQTALVKLFFYPNDVIERRLKELSYVYYSRQYTCYYIRWRDSVFQQFKRDLKGIVAINMKYLKPEDNKDHKKNNAVQRQPKSTSPPLKNASVISIVLVNDKTYLKLPIPYKKEWVEYLLEQGCVFESKRCFWMVPGFAKNQSLLRHYFQSQGCTLKIRVKHNEKILDHLKKKNYREDEEIIAFIKVMTLQGAAKRTIENYASQIKKVKDYYNGKQMAVITDDEIRDYLFFLREELSYSASAQNIVVSAIKRFLLSLTEREFNPYHIPRPVKKKTLPKILEKEEVIALLKLDIYIKHQCMLYLLYSTGVRCGELVNLKVEDIRFGSHLIVIKKGKGSKDRIVTLSEKIKDLLLRYMQMEKPNTYLFEGQKGGKCSTSSVQKMVKRAVMKAGIDRRVTPHMLRHSFATHLHDSGMDIRNIQMLLGHASTKTTEIYTYVSKRDITKLKSPLDDLDV